MKTVSCKTVVVASSLALLAALSAAPAAAGAENLDYSYPPLGKFESNKTRDEVRAELFQAIKDGSLAQATNTGPLVTPRTPPSSLTREAVMAEAIQWVRDHHGDNHYMGGAS